jgi:flagellar hook-associated protein 3 FlgL
MKQQIYQEGNTNYAGRYVFTGYKTDSPLTFTNDSQNLHYTITENIAGDQIQVGNKVIGGYDISDYESGSTFDASPQIINTYRIQLAYDNLDNAAINSISYTKSVDGGEPVAQTPFTNIAKVSALDDDAYQPDPDEAHFIYETGELILGKNVYEELRTADNMQITYEKSSFNKGDLKPENYFNCVMNDTEKPEQEPITYTKTKQQIEYEINYNQKLIINTEGSDAISHKIGRDIDNILNSINDVSQVENTIAEVNKRLTDTTLADSDKQRYQKMLDQLDTELELKKEVMQNAFEKGITSSNQEQDRVNKAVADLGSRYNRLELTENRLSSQKVDFEDLLSKNEDTDMVETVIKYNSAETIYNASLSAASKVVQNTLLNFL